MTGVAAQLCADAAEVQQLGYIVRGSEIWAKDDWDARVALDADRKNPHPHLQDPAPFSRLGARRVILSDLSPAATFIAYNYNNVVNAESFQRNARQLLAEVEAECGWMYTTLHGCSENETEKWAERLRRCKTTEDAKAACEAIPADKKGTINCVLWSDVLRCPHCPAEHVFWNHGIDRKEAKVFSTYQCPGCKIAITKDECDRATVMAVDPILKTIGPRSKQAIVAIVYLAAGKRSERAPGAFDEAMVDVIERTSEGVSFISDRMMDLDPPWGQMFRGGYHADVSHAHHFFGIRSLRILSACRRREPGQAAVIRFLLTAVLNRSSRMNRLHLKNYFLGGGGWNAGYMKGTLYVPSLPVEASVLEQLSDRIDSMKAAFKAVGLKRKNIAAITTESTTSCRLPPESLDYVFIDPPFGGNLVYSELNFLWESWLGVKTRNELEALTSAFHEKGVHEYRELMSACLRSVHAALKPGRWVTVEFHNSENAIWHAIRSAIEAAGLVIADVRVLDKKQLSFKQVTTSSAAKQDLVISCYKPTTEFERRFSVDVGKPAAVRDFVEQHLNMVPVTPVNKDKQLERLAERTASILYDRMIAYHLVRGAAVPMSGSEFTTLLHENFTERDGMWFLPGQEVRYDLCRLRGVEVEQQVLFVTDERSGVSWLRCELGLKPQVLGELTHKYLQATKEWPDHEPRPELRDLLRDWFIEVDGRWANPNPDDEKHVEALRKKSLLRLFATYAAGKGKLKEFRREALIEAFRYCWNSGQEAVFVTVCQRIPDKLLREDAQLSEAYDLAADRVASRPTPVQQEFEWE
jgi:16S rRNA G966 N2-methylase RsmD